MLEILDLESRGIVLSILQGTVAMPLGMQATLKSVPASGTFFCEDLGPVVQSIVSLTMSL